MPIMKCTLNGKPGYKYGKSGICYTGDDAKDKAIAQGRAILISQANKAGIDDKDDIEAYVSEHIDV